MARPKLPTRKPIEVSVLADIENVVRCRQTLGESIVSAASAGALTS